MTHAQILKTRAHDAAAEYYRLLEAVVKGKGQPGIQRKRFQLAEAHKVKLAAELALKAYTNPPGASDMAPTSSTSPVSRLDRANYPLASKGVSGAFGEAV